MTPLPPAAITCGSSLTRNEASQTPPLSMLQCWLACSCSGLVQVASDVECLRTVATVWPEDVTLQHSCPWCADSSFSCVYFPPSSRVPPLPDPLSGHSPWPPSHLLLYLPPFLSLPPTLPIFLIMSRVLCYSLLYCFPTCHILAVIPCFFPGFCGYYLIIVYSILLYAYISRFGVRSHQWKRTCDVCLFGLGYLSIVSSLVSSIYLESSWVLFSCNRRLEFQAECEPIA